MAIELKTNLSTPNLAEHYIHDARVAHALTQAIEEAKAATRETYIGDPPDDSHGPWWIESRASTILTELLAGKGEV